MKLVVNLENLSLLLLFLILPMQLLAAVRLPGIFTNNMMIQRNIPFNLWGWASPGERISIKTSWNSIEHSIIAGTDDTWRINIEPPNVGGPYFIKIAGENMITLDNLLCGDVWICSGQSNMEMGLKIVSNGAAEIRQANYPGIRLYDLKKAESDTILSDVKGEWKLCSPETVIEGDWEGFSAVAYFFGRRIHKELSVPVGLIDISWSATHIEPWIAPEGYNTVREVSELYKNRYQTDSGGVWGEPYRPARIYNAMIAPIRTLSIRGVLWYQGESNVGDGMRYYYKMEALIRGWREVWKQGDFPFYYVQIAPYSDYPEDELAKLWEAQNKTLEIPNTGLAKTEDIGDWNDIHPKNKLDVGERLAKIALKQTYGIK